MSHKEDVLGQPAMTQILSKLHDKNNEEKKVISLFLNFKYDVTIKRLTISVIDLLNQLYNFRS